MKSKMCCALLPIILLCTWIPAQTQKNSREEFNSLSREGIKGNVIKTEVRFFTIDTLKKWINQDSCCITITEFDRKGNGIKVGRYTTGGIYQGGTVTNYHANGLIKRIRFLNKDKRETAREDYFIDGMGKYTGGEAYAIFNHSSIEIRNAGFRMDSTSEEVP